MKRLAILILSLLLFQTVAAQDSAGVYVCRDPRFAWVRLEFHNLPQGWVTPNDSEPGIWYLAAGGYLYEPERVLIVDGIEPDSIQMNNPGAYPGLAILGLNDYSFELRGDADSPLCDPALSPLQLDELTIILTPQPTPQTQPEPIALDSQNCVKLAYDGATGRAYYCYKTLSDVVPPPPPPA